ncbi:MAG: DUF1441 family protein [Gammaproteobacteria bacterium]|nr:DUF1441 family protein [Gammaproteobacteria bacterium]
MVRSRRDTRVIGWQAFSPTKSAIPDAPGTGRRRETTVDPEEMQPKDRRDWYEGEKTRLFLECEAKTLLVGEDVRRGTAILIQAVLGPFITFPDLLERDHGASPEMVVAAEQLVDQLREEAYERLMTDLDEQEGDLADAPAAFVEHDDAETAEDG